MKRARKVSVPVPRVQSPTRFLVAASATLCVIALVLVGLWRLNDEARRGIGDRERYRVNFADIRCDAPPGMTHKTFLIEVRYGSNSPSSVQSMDPELEAKLTAAFASHPWVERVDAVSVEAEDAIAVKLAFRSPALAVRTATGNRAVDAKGNLLPASAPTTGLPELLTPVAAPGKAGRPWPDDAVIRAASVAAEYKPKTIERTAQGWELIQPDGKKLIVGG